MSTLPDPEYVSYLGYAEYLLFSDDDGTNLNVTIWDDGGHFVGISGRAGSGELAVEAAQLRRLGEQFAALADLAESGSFPSPASPEGSATRGTEQ